MTLNIRSREFRGDPYPFFRRLRAEAPICRTEPFGHWAVARHADVLAVLKNPKLFLSSGIGPPSTSTGPQFLLETRSIVGEDPPDHTRLRALISKAFAPITVTTLEPRIREIAKALIRRLRDKGDFDFVSEFASPLPVIVLAEILGIDPDRTEAFKRWSDTLLTWRSGKPVDETRRVIEEMFDDLTGIIAERSKNPRHDLISALVQAAENEQKLTADEVLGFVRFLLVAGNETTTNLLGNTTLALLSHPDEWARVREDRALVPKLIEEALRYDGPALSLIRRVAEDTSLAGTKLRKGELVLPLLGSANHDESEFFAPERFDIERNSRGHLAFGTGIHFCLGAQLAKLQARIAFEELLGAFPGFERVGDEPLEFIESFFFRGVKRLKLARSS